MTLVSLIEKMEFEQDFKMTALSSIENAEFA